MPTQLRWLVSESASCLHAAALIAGGKRLADPRAAPALAEPCRELVATFHRFDLSLDRFLQHAVPLSAGVENDRQLAEVALRKTFGQQAADETRITAVAEAIRRLETPYRHELPGLVDELELRTRPLRDQWDARAPGMLHQLAQLTDQVLIVPTAEAILVQPAAGGGGAAHLAYNSIRIEAVLANPHDHLPEVVRLAWLVSQLNLDLPMLSENIHRDRLPMIAAIAMLRPVLTAAERVELVPDAEAAVESAIRAWEIDVRFTGEAQTLADIAAAWWATYQSTRPPLRVALEALDRMVEENG